MAWYNPSDPVQRNWMLGGIVALALIYPYRTWVLQPRQAANAEVRTRVENLEQQNSRAAVLAARGGGDLQERLDLYQRHVGALEQLIPAQEEVAALIDDVQSRARRVDVDVKGLDPEPPQQLEFYDLHAYSMSVVGEYHSVGRFLADIASLSRIVTPVEVDLQLYQAPQEYPELTNPVLATFRIETYVVPDRPAEPAPEAGNS